MSKRREKKMSPSHLTSIPTDSKQIKRVNAHEIRKQIGIKTTSGKRLVDLYKEGK
jgi:hypothetical protein